MAVDHHGQPAKKNNMKFISERVKQILHHWKIVVMLREGLKKVILSLSGGGGVSRCILSLFFLCLEMIFKQF